MTTPDRRQLPPANPPAFALPAVLIVVSAMLILAIGLLLVTSIERRSARAFVDQERAALAAMAALDDVRATLARETADDAFVVIAGRPAAAAPNGKTPAANLFVARGRAAGGGISYRYIPLFSHRLAPSNTARLEAPDPAPLIAGADTGFETHPYLDDARAAWTPVADSRGRIVARYAWWTEDLQGRLDASKAGNLAGTDGTHTRAVFPFPAPGHAVDFAIPLAEAALHAIDPAARDDSQGALAATLIGNRPLLISPASTLAAAGARPPLARDVTTGRLADPQWRGVEESLAASTVSYHERPLIPFANGIAPAVAGTPKVNLNAMLALGGDSAVNTIADHIRRALPEFEQRGGGFPEDYLKSLAASAIDYAAAPGTPPTIAPGKYRGIGAWPHVSEHLMTFRWENTRQQDGRYIISVAAATYIELWNMTSLPLDGDVQLSYEAAYSFALGWSPENSLANLDNATHNLIESDGRRWFPPQSIALAPNEYRVIHCGTVRYEFDAGAITYDRDGRPIPLAEPVVFGGEAHAARKSGYHLRWNGALVDRAGGGIHRIDAAMRLGTQAVRTTVAGHSYEYAASGKLNNMGDPRVAWHAAAPQDANSYPRNYSPNRRNIRRGTIYDGDGSAKPRVYGRVLPAEWPDGGHNSIYSLGAPFTTSDVNTAPDDPRFFANLPPTFAGEAPQRLSRRGRYFSATELGNLFDPVMWQPTYPSADDTRQIRNGFMPTGRERWPEVERSSPPSPDHGGGNTLRIGRPEHPAFDTPGDRSKHAVRLLDLFHTGIPASDNPAAREGPLVRIDGHVNLNTATRDALRALAAGPLAFDPRIRRRLGPAHFTSNLFAPRTAPLELSAPENDILADRVADAIIAARPLATPADIVFARTPDGEPVFGNRNQYPDAGTIHWHDAAAEELFARVHNSATVRSRNFRVWIVAQALAPTTPENTNPQVLAEVRKTHTLHATPGERDTEGAIIPGNTTTRVIHESDF